MSVDGYWINYTLSIMAGSIMAKLSKWAYALMKYDNYSIILSYIEKIILPYKEDVFADDRKRGEAWDI